MDSNHPKRKDPGRDELIGTRRQTQNEHVFVCLKKNNIIIIKKKKKTVTKVAVSFTVSLEDICAHSSPGRGWP